MLLYADFVVVFYSFDLNLRFKKSLISFMASSPVVPHDF